MDSYKVAAEHKKVAEAEGKEDYNASFNIMENIATSLGYNSSMTDDGNWIFTKKGDRNTNIQILFDSSRGVGIPVREHIKGKESRDISRDSVYDLAKRCTKFMKTN